jgi:ABC-type branched-subunit amino acid transport system substrate-binding protein
VKRRPGVVAVALALVAGLLTANFLAGCSVHHPGANGVVAPDRVVSLTADTDRGVTKSTITVGAVVYRQDTFAQFGLGSLGGRPADQLLKPFVDDINAHGGIAGRRLIVKVSQFSPLVPAESQTACVDQADDQKVFLTLAEVSLTDDAQERCLAARQTPVITSNSSTLADLQADGGWVHQISMAKDRVFKDWVDWLISSRIATPASRIGLVHSDNPEDNALVASVILPYLHQRGLTVAAQAAFSGLTIPTVTGDAQNAVLRFKSAGVDLVLPDLDFLRFFVFQQAASSADLKVRYSVSDLGQLSLDAATNFYPAAFGGTRGVTAYAGGLGSPPGATGDLSPALQDCLDVYQAGGQPVTSSSTAARLAEVLQVAQFCEELRLVAHVASVAGPHLNRASFLAAFNQVGNWTDGVTLTGPLSFGPTKFDGPDRVAVIEWHADCGTGASCYGRVEPVKKGRW